MSCSVRVQRLYDLPGKKTRSCCGWALIVQNPPTPTITWTSAGQRRLAATHQCNWKEFLSIYLSIYSLRKKTFLKTVSKLTCVCRATAAGCVKPARRKTVSASCCPPVLVGCISHQRSLEMTKRFLWNKEQKHNSLSLKCDAAVKIEGTNYVE